MEEKAREFLDLLDNDDEFSEAQCNEFQKKFDDYLESLTEQEQEYFVSNYGRRIIGLLFCKRYKIKTIKNKKTLEFINRINHPEGLTAEQLIQLSITVVKNGISNDRQKQSIDAEVSIL